MKKRPFLILTLILTMAWNTNVAMAFDHITGQHWAEKEINNLYSRGLLSIYEVNNFNPNEPVTRAELAAMLVAIFQLEDEAKSMGVIESSFTDVADDHWAKGAIEIAKEYDLIKGYSPTTFAPEDIVNREQLATILVRTKEKHADKPSTSVTNNNSFIDEKFISSWAKEPVAIAVDLGIVSGFPDKTFRPKYPVSRSQMAVMLERLLSAGTGPYQFYGFIQGGDPEKQQLEVTVNGQCFPLPVADNCIYYSPEGHSSYWADIPTFTPVFFNMDKLGAINFIVPANDEYDLPLFNVATLNQMAQQKKISSSSIVAGKQLTSMTNADYLVDMALTAQLTGSEMNVPQLKQELAVTGKGVKVAVIDTGVDPSHPDLQVAQFIDVTDEGLIPLEGKAVKKGQFSLPEMLEEELTVVLVPDQHEPMVYISAPHDHSLEKYLDQVGEEQFASTIIKAIEKGQVAVIGQQGYPLYRSSDHAIPVATISGLLNMAFTEVDTKGQWLKLSFDGNGHGTHVAGTIAAKGKLTGIAPDVQLIAVKALNLYGESDVPTLKKAVTKAVAAGADIVNISLSYQSSYDMNSQDELTLYLDSLAEEQGITFVVAAGNDGPGVHTVAIPGSSAGVITVGAYISPAMYQAEYNLKLTDEIMWDYSSTGPSGHGGMKPDIVAPGMLWSTFPLWTGDGYMFDEGTSMAAPQVSGVLALIMEAARNNKLHTNPFMLKTALQQAAVPIADLSILEQGYGKVDAMATWRKLTQVKKEAPITVSFLGSSAEQGYLYLRQFKPGILYLQLTNNGLDTVPVQVHATEEWLNPVLSQLSIPAKATRTVPINFKMEERKGLNVGKIVVASPNMTHIDVVNTVILPHSPAEQIAKAGVLAAGKRERYYIEVAENTRELTVNLRILDTVLGKPEGRARMHLYNPSGYEWEVTPFVGAGSNFNQVRLAEKIQVPFPQAGVWEIVVASSSWLDNYHLTDTSYVVSSFAKPMDLEQGETMKPSYWVIGMMPSAVGSVAGNANLHIFNAASGQWYEGPVVVDQVLYYAKRGIVPVAVTQLKLDEINILLQDV